MSGKRTIYSLDDPLGFGKHADLSIRELADEDPDYLEWLYDEDFLEFDSKSDFEEFKELAGY